MSLLIFGKAVTRRKIADKVKMNRSHFNRPIQLANLTPDIVKREVLYFIGTVFATVIAENLNYRRKK